MQLNRRQLDVIFSILKVVPRRSSHHVAGYVEIDETKVLLVHYSRGRSEMPEVVGHRFRKSLHLNVNEFIRLRDGDMTRDQYIEIVKARLKFDEDF